MVEVVEILIGQNKFLCLPGKYTLKKGTNIIVNTDKGLQYAVVTMPNYSINAKNVFETLYRIARIASGDDYRKNKKNINDSKFAFNKCKSLIKKYKLNMSLISASYTFDRKQLLFEFVSDERVDFRSLARDLANIYKTRIELHQIGVRDKAKMIGGCGQCGKELCCKQFLKDFNSVSINMVKNQNLSLNPNKINGVCGRLLCCLKYEDDCYQEYRLKLPSVGKIVKTEHGRGKVISIDVLKQSYRVDVEDYGIVECETSGSNK